MGEIADLRSVSVETVRVQLKALLAKTGCGRQAELVLRLGQLCLPAPGADGT